MNTKQHPAVSNQKSLVLLIVLTLLSFLTSGCAVFKMYDHMQVRKGSDPENQDKSVLFRNIYYYRAIEYCKDKNGENGGLKKTYTRDSLFRFRMTGKAYPIIANKVHFEAGILHKSEIDPFGTPITYDKKEGRFRYTSKQEVEAKKKQAQLEALDDDFKNLIALSKELKSSETTISAANKAKFEGFINKRIDDLTKAAEKQGTQAVVTAIATTQCQDGNPAFMEFWILGPEGWQRFDADERLVLAMSTSGKPIVGPMKELAGRLLNEQNAGQDQSSLLADQLNVSKAQDYLRQDDTAGKDSQLIVETVVNQLQGKTSEPKEGK